MDVLPPSGKGTSAELNSEEKVVVPSIHTSNVKATLERIKEFGGKILKDKTPIGKEAEFGYFAIFADPNGNKMCLYSEKSRSSLKITTLLRTLISCFVILIRP